MSDRARIVFEYRIDSLLTEEESSLALRQLADEIIEACTYQEAAQLLRRLAFVILERYHNDKIIMEYRKRRASFDDDND